LLAVGTDATNQNLNLWQVSTGTLVVGRITAHQNGTKSVAFSPDGSILATVGPDHTTKMWRVPDMALMRTMVDGPNDSFRVFSVAFSPDGQLIASATNKIVHIWRASDGALLRTLNGSFPVAFSPDGSTLVSSSPEHALKFWSVPSGALLRSISRPTETIMSLTFSRDGQFVLASGYVTFTARDGTMQSSGMIRFFRAGDGSLFQAYDRGLDIAVPAIAISPDGRLFGYGLYGGGFAVARSPF